MRIWFLSTCFFCCASRSALVVDGEGEEECSLCLRRVMREERDDVLATEAASASRGMVVLAVVVVVVKAVRGGKG